MTYEQNVRETAEKMARITYQGFDQNDQSWKDVVITQHISLAEIAVSMKAEGFDEGRQHAKLIALSPDSKSLKTYDEHMQFLGLTKPTHND